MAILTTKPIDSDILWSRIAIRPPYFALDDLGLESDGTVSARIPVQQPIGQEHGQIAAAEVGRHLAILGVCAIALQQEDSNRRYYLAQKAHLAKHTQGLPCLNHGVLLGSAKPEYIDRRTAKANTQLLLAGNEVLYDLTVEYALVPERLFARLFGNQRIPMMVRGEDGINPYSHSIPLVDVNISGTQLTGSLSVDSPDRCAGHFPEFPAIPVAILMQALCNASSILMQQILGVERLLYTVTEAQVRAANLAFADELISIEVEHIHRNGELHVLNCTARTKPDREVGYMELTIVV
ncbi:MAG: hypothetical protein ACPGYT_01315 [Nitrospirales bacterium]